MWGEEKSSTLWWIHKYTNVAECLVISNSLWPNEHNFTWTNAALSLYKLIGLIVWAILISASFFFFLDSLQIKYILHINRKFVRDSLCSVRKFLKCLDITLTTKLFTFKVMIFLFEAYSCGSWTSRMMEIRKLDGFELYWKKMLKKSWKIVEKDMIQTR